MRKKPGKLNRHVNLGNQNTSFSTLLDAIDPELESQRREHLKRQEKNCPKATPKKPGKPPKSRSKPKKTMTFEEKLERTNQWLRETFPTLFDPTNPKALDEHIIRDIKAHYKNEQAQRKYPEDLVIKAALYRYIDSPAYRACLVNGAPRYNMYGEVVGIVEAVPQEPETP